MVFACPTPDVVKDEAMGRGQGLDGKKASDLGEVFFLDFRGTNRNFPMAA